MSQTAPPVLALRFGQGGADDGHLLLGWSAPEFGRTWTAGDESILQLERPAAPGDYLAELDCEPFLPPGLAAQRVHVLVNGRMAGSFAVTAPTRLACRLPWDAIAAAPRVTLTLLLPDAARPSDRLSGSRDRRSLALALKAMRVTATTPASEPAAWGVAAQVAGEPPRRGAARVRLPDPEQLEPPQADIDRVRALQQGPADGAARRKLDRIVNRRGGGLFFLPQLANAVIAAGVQLGHLDRLTPALGEALGIEARLTVDDGTRDHRGAGAVLWDVAADGSATFRFRRKLNDHSFARMLIDNWLRCLPAYARYLRLPAAGRVAGRTWLNQEFMGVLPGVAFCDFRPGYQLMMDPRFIGTNAYEQPRGQLAAAPVRWEERRPVALWRGQLSNPFPPKGPHGPDAWRMLPRVRLALLARTLGDAVDAGLTGIVSVQDARQVAEIEANGLLRQRLPWGEYNRFKYHLDVDGHTSSWSGLFVRLCSGGVVLKVQSAVGFRQWYYDRLVPFVNFVPVQADMADLADKLAWLRAHDAEARAIGEAGRALALSMSVESETIAAQPAFRAALSAGAPGG